MRKLMLAGLTAGAVLAATTVAGCSGASDAEPQPAMEPRVEGTMPEPAGALKMDTPRTSEPQIPETNDPDMPDNPVPDAPVNPDEAKPAKPVEPEAEPEDD